MDDSRGRTRRSGRWVALDAPTDATTEHTTPTDKDAPMRAWLDPPSHHRSNVGLGVGLLAIALLCLVAILALAGKAGAWEGCAPEDGCYPSTTQATTTTTEATTTTVKPTTTTVASCGLCAGQFSSTTTLPATSTTATSVATTIPDTTPVDQTVATTVPVVTEAPTTVPQSLPVTGGNPWWLALFGACLVALGGLAVAWKRTP